MIKSKGQMIIFLVLIIIIASITEFLVLRYVEFEENCPINGCSLKLPMLRVDVENEVLMELVRRFNPNLSEKKQVLICKSIMNQAIQANLEPFFVAGVIAAESSFRPNVVSPCKARGLMQITRTVSHMMCINNPLDIEQNIYAGTKYLKMLHQQFLTDELVLAAYNSGPTRVARLKRVPHIRETINYVRRVIRYRNYLKTRLCNRVKLLMDRSHLAVIIVNRNLKSSQDSYLMRKGLHTTISLALNEGSESRKNWSFFI